MNPTDGLTEVAAAVSEAMTPDPPLWLDIWSERNVVIPKGSPFAGRYSLELTPYARRILQALSPEDPAQVVVCMVASQMLKTQVFICAALGWIAEAPANILALEPTDKLAKRLSSRIDKSIALCDAVVEKVAKPRSRDSRNTIDHKDFDGGALHIVTAGSASNLAEIPARYGFMDEVDRVLKLPTEGHPWNLLLARLTAYEGISKAYAVSSPLVDGESKIDELRKLGTCEEYHVPCPHCDHLHALRRSGLRYDYDEERQSVRRAWFVCPECGGEIDEHHKPAMFADEAFGGRARWVSTQLGDGKTVSVWLPAYYAPLGSISWSTLALELVRALQAKKRGDDDPLRTYTNTRDALPFKADESTTTAQALMARAEDYAPRTIPDRALVVTMFADVQVNRLEVTITAWGEGLERWVVDHVVLFGSPAEEPSNPQSVWAQLDQLRATPWAHESGAIIYASCYGVDTGGANTQDVYNYAAQRKQVGCVATKGSSTRGKPIIAAVPSKVDVDWRGQRLKDGVELWWLGPDTAKDHLFARLDLTDGPGAIHFHRALELDYFEQLLSESVRTEYHKGRAVRVYHLPKGARNEALDCAVGNTGMAYYLGLHKWSAHDWRLLRQRLVPARPNGADPDALAAIPGASTQPIAPPPPQQTGRRMLSRGLA